MRRRRQCARALCCALALAAGPAAAADSAVVFLYHRVGEAAYPLVRLQLARIFRFRQRRIRALLLDPASAAGPTGPGKGQAGPGRRSG